MTQQHGPIGEQRYTSAGNVFELVAGANDHLAAVKRIKASEHFSETLWDKDVTYYWPWSCWESIPRIGEQADDPSFGLFLP